MLFSSAYFVFRFLPVVLVLYYVLGRRVRNLLLFVEVKARANLDAAAEAVTLRQQQRIAAAAEAWLATYPDPRVTDIRFDAVLVAPGKMPRHIPGAFEAT